MRLLVAAVFAIAAAGIWQLGFVGLIQPPTAPSNFKVAMGAAQGETGVTQTSAPEAGHVIGSSELVQVCHAMDSCSRDGIPCRLWVRGYCTEKGAEAAQAQSHQGSQGEGEKDKQAMEEGAFMDTFLGQLVTTITLGISVLLILWEIYLNTLYPRVYPTYNPLNPQIMVDESMQEDQ
eukprot:s902_g11.t1